MIIQLSPINSYTLSAPELVRDGDALIINGERHELAALQALTEDEAYPAYIVEVRADTITVLLPYTEDAPEAVRFPAPINDPPDGPIPLPQGAEEDQT